MKRQTAHQTLRLSEDLKAQIAQIGIKRQMTTAEVIREALGFYLNSQVTLDTK